MATDGGASLIRPIGDSSPDRPLILILPGLSGNLSQWDLVRDRLEHQGIDLAFGSPILPHPALPARPTIPALVKGLSEELAAQGRTDVMLVAHSVGAFTALGLAARDQSIVRSVILVNGGLFTVARFLDRPWQQLFARPRICLKALKLFILVGAPSPAFVQRFIAHAPWSSRLVLGDLVSRAGLATQRQRTAMMQESGRPQAWRALWINRHHWREFLGHAPRITAPVQFLSGECDPIAGEAESRQMADLLPQATVQCLPGVGHAGPLESADRVAEFLESALHTLTEPRADHAGNANS